MKLSENAKEYYARICDKDTKMGDIKKLAKEIRTNHDMALELWSTGDYHARLLAVLIMDKKKLTLELLEGLTYDAQAHGYDECNQVADWLLANQLTKSKVTIGFLESWENHPRPMMRRLFWYYQARLRWTGKTPPGNSSALMDSLESGLGSEAPQVQWAMNFCAFQIGLRELEYRERCIALGERLGLYKDEPYSRGCTPNYLPEAIRIEAEKMRLS